MLAEHLKILDVDEVLSIPAWKLSEWKAFFRLRYKRQKELDDIKDKTEEAKNRAKRG